MSVFTLPSFSVFQEEDNGDLAPQACRALELVLRL